MISIKNQKLIQSNKEQSMSIIGSIIEHSIFSMQSKENNYLISANMKVEKVMASPFPHITEGTAIGPIKSLLENYQSVIVIKKDKPI
ncbi:MAG: hypothetical protein V3S79_02970 [Candidatus Thermoplasmatota archaeon]